MVLCLMFFVFFVPSRYAGLQVSSGAADNARLPRTAEGKPNLQGIWQAHNRAAYDLEDHEARLGMLAGRTVVEGGSIPYQPWAAAKRADNFSKRRLADPLEQCFMPGVPRIMYMDFPFHIFQTREQIAVLFEWSQAYRLIYTNASRPPDGIDFWMGDSRGRWDGDTLVVSVTNHNDKTWFDMAGNFHSDALRLVERYTMTDADTIRYQVTIEDPKVFTRPGRSPCRSIVKKTWTASSSISATPKRRRRAARFLATR